MQNNVLDTVKEFNKICFDILQVFGLLLFFFFFLHLVNAGDVAHLIKKALALPLFMMKIIRTKNCPLRFFFFFRTNKCWLCLQRIIVCYDTHCFLLKNLFSNFTETKTDEILKNICHIVLGKNYYYSILLLPGPYYCHQPPTLLFYLLSRFFR